MKFVQRLSVAILALFTVCCHEEKSIVPEMGTSHLMW